MSKVIVPLSAKPFTEKKLNRELKLALEILLLNNFKPFT